jgi:hypothetical protein
LDEFFDSDFNDLKGMLSARTTLLLMDEFGESDFNAVKGMLSAPPPQLTRLSLARVKGMFLAR